jgi:glycosyltransferase involved in cell wall biosynthesis
MLCFVFPPRFSGAAMQALSLARALNGHGVPCVFVAPNYFDRRLWWRGTEGESVVYRLGIGPWSFAFLFFLFLALNRRRYSVLHIHGFAKSHFLCVLTGRFFGLQVVQKMTKGGADNSELGRKGLLAPIRQHTLRLISDFIAISSPLYRGISGLGIPRYRIHQIPNGVDLSKFECGGASNRQHLCTTYGLDEHDMLLLCAGVVDKRKNQLLILKSLDTMRLGRPNIWGKTCLTVVGPFHNPAYTDLVLRYVHDNSLDSRVRFLGALQQDELIRLNTVCDICVFAGNNEGMPNALLEAKAASMPSVAFRADGVDDVVRDGVDGFVVPFGDEVQFARQLSRLIEDTALRSVFRQNARRDAEQRFSLEKIARRYMREVYRPVSELAPVDVETQNFRSKP